jgi:hypothetical protein
VTSHLLALRHSFPHCKLGLGMPRIYNDVRVDVSEFNSTESTHLLVKSFATELSFLAFGNA